MSLSINESLSAAQESYFEGEFRASADKLDAILAREQVTTLPQKKLIFSQLDFIDFSYINPFINSLIGGKNFELNRIWASQISQHLYSAKRSLPPEMTICMLTCQLFY
jgi:hypothetical protein